MTIKDVEERTGLSRSNIRFYIRKCSLLKGGINNEEKIIIYH